MLLATAVVLSLVGSTQAQYITSTPGLVGAPAPGPGAIVTGIEAKGEWGRRTADNVTKIKVFVENQKADGSLAAADGSATITIPAGTPQNPQPMTANYSVVI